VVLIAIMGLVITQSFFAVVKNCLNVRIENVTFPARVHLKKKNSGSEPQQELIGGKPPVIPLNSVTL
jgi:hypothetical protein